MSRKCFSSLPSSFASFYLITACFAISLISLFYLKFPQPHIHPFEYKTVKINNPTITTTTTTTTTSTTALLTHDFIAPSVDESNEDVDPTEIQTSPQDLQDTPPLVVNNLDESLSVDQLSIPPVVTNPSVDKESVPLVGNDPENDAVSLPTTKATDDAEVKINDQISPSTESDEETNKHYVSEPASVNQSEEKHVETDVADEDEAAVMSYDHITYTPANLTAEQRMEWFKQRVPESKILESTPKTRKFEFKMQRFVRDKRCSVNIYMNWISSTSLFGKREMFCLESIVKAHPHACVIIISRIMGTKFGRQVIQPLIDRGHMILTVAPDYPLLFEGTPAHDWYERLKAGQQDPGPIAITQNLSNILRLVVLYKYGGIYLDSDMIILKDISSLRNTIGIQVVDYQSKTWGSVNNAVLNFDKDHPLLLRFMEEFNSTFNGSYWGWNGPFMTTRVIQRVIHDRKYEFNLISPMAFYPVGWLDIQDFFRYPFANESSWNENMFNKVSKESYGVHLWNKYSRDLRIENGSIIGRLISKHCVLCQDIYGS